MKKIIAVMVCMVIMLGTFSAYAANAVVGRDNIVESLSLDCATPISPKSEGAMSTAGIPTGNIDFPLRLENTIVFRSR